MTSPANASGFVIPDFEKDAAALASYDEARVRYERSEAASAESKTRAVFEKKRDAIRAEINVAATLLEERKYKAQRALNDYQKRYPANVDDKGRASPPGFWQNLFGFGRPGSLYKLITKTQAEAMNAQTLRRRKEHDEEDLEAQYKRSIFLEEEAIKKRLESNEGVEAFHKKPGVAALHKRVLEVRAERAAYADRLSKGSVTPQEQCQREFAEKRILHIEAPFTNLLIIRIAQYGDLTYFILRDLERKLYALAYDPRLEPLVDNVFDVYRIADNFEAKAGKNADGRPMTALDHFLASYREQEVARTEYRKARTALRQPRQLPAMKPYDSAEAALIDVLLGHARQLAALPPGAVLAQASAVTAPAPEIPLPASVDAAGSGTAAPETPTT